MQTKLTHGSLRCRQIQIRIQVRIHIAGCRARSSTSVEFPSQATVTKPGSRAAGHWLVFLAFGTVVGSWTSRIPSIKIGLNLSNSQLGIALIAFAAGSITGMVVLGRAIDRVGRGPVMTVLVAAQGVFLILPALAPEPWALSVALLALGSVQGTLNVAMNANAVEVQRGWRSPIMSSFHAIL